MNNLKPVLTALLAGVLIGAALIHFLYPRFEERTEFKDREVVKYRTITRTIQRPDGTKEEEKVEEGRTEKDTKFKQEKLQQNTLTGFAGTERAIFAKGQ